MEKHHKFSIWYVLLGIWFVLILNNLISAQIGPKQIPYSEFLNQVRSDKVKEIAIGKERITGKMLDSSGKEISFNTVRVTPDLAKELQGHQIEFRGEVESTFLRSLFSWMVPVFLFLGIWYFMMKRMGPGQGVMSFAGNKAKVYAEEDIPTRFEDVAGVDEAKEELEEVVQFLRTPDKFTRLGGRMPKGVLLVGPPGTGKTLLSRAVAGEAGVPFFSISGSEFVELFVGMGAARVRDLFKQARDKAPCIVFIDELDALGKARGMGSMGGHDEREQTLQQLLVEMDGFDPRAGVIIMAATNRPEILDPALLRAGRFDRQVLVDKPDLNGRIAILEVHAKRISLGDDVDLKVLAQRTPGLSGADLENILNEGALLAARANRDEVTMADLEEAVDRIVGGLEKKNRVINSEEKKRVAYHETGHALVASFTPKADKVHKISIIPRGIAALGYTEQRPTEDRYLMAQSELQGKVDVMLGGRVAERIIFGEVSTGAANDLQRATDLVLAMLTQYGMGNTLGPVTYARRGQPVFIPQDSAFAPQPNEFSEATAAALDEELRRFMEDREQHVENLLSQHRDLLEKVAVKLLDVEVLDEPQFRELIGKVEGEEVEEQVARLDAEKPDRPGDDKSTLGSHPAGPDA
ncbi:MAG: ATP-dependent zinc metalloprotease FtsH [Desulfarculaceae bacterium]|nr:ATP-dependent zinc metalloprotease FtsH [Desulfarculaceae bacterium]MCF8072169.1 ATP-dependent zinc metalloprotease FtsH [Desulfarculaceae bacterium]MCF8100090.1 ATP-dependent zinc metalloprotease FtsH [Desulfarculaceae bacterium]MCF8117935.1 ATP-dependent zinc metalloprotease FtsH [Desulfarculaceae bacterium]